nr:RNA-directed DNA polymerase, eukaryota [Tanacetum cinerariifolium]
MADRWVWKLEGTGVFSVASARRLFDELRLPNLGMETRWIKCVSIKVNVLAWKIWRDALPTRFNISRRGIDTGRVRSGDEDSQFNSLLEIVQVINLVPCEDSQDYSMSHGSGHGSGHGSAHSSAHGSGLVHDDEEDSPVEEVSPVKPKKPSRRAAKAKKDETKEVKEPLKK